LLLVHCQGLFKNKLLGFVSLTKKLFLQDWTDIINKWEIKGKTNCFGFGHCWHLNDADIPLEQKQRPCIKAFVD
jgi:hypothetical protein